MKEGACRGPGAATKTKKTTEHTRELTFPDNGEFQDRSWTVERIGWNAIVPILVAALMDGFGRGFAVLFFLSVFSLVPCKPLAWRNYGVRRRLAVDYFRGGTAGADQQRHLDERTRSSWC